MSDEANDSPSPPPAQPPPAEPAPPRNRGQFKPGNRVNPGGRPRSSQALRKRLTEIGPLAVKVLEDTMRSPRTAAAAKVRAALEVLAYSLGRPPTTTAITGADGGPLIPATAAESPIARLVAAVAARKAAAENALTPGATNGNGEPHDTAEPESAAPGANGAATEVPSA